MKERSSREFPIAVCPLSRPPHSGHKTKKKLSPPSQEASLQRHRARLVGAGLLDDAGEAWLRPRREQTLDESERTFEVLSEVLAAQTRVDAPGAAEAAERRWRRHRTGAPPPLSAEDVEVLRRARASAAAAGTLSLGGYGASALVLPKLSLRPRDFGGGAAAAAAPPPLPVPPAVAEAAARGLATGARAAAYGSALALAGAALGSLLAARSMMRSSGGGGEESSGGGAAAASLATREALSPLGDAVRGALGPVVSWARGEIGGEGGEGGGEEGRGRKKKPNSAAAADAFSASLGRRLDASRRKWASRAGIGSDSV